jgi:hypothetical protein
MSLEVKVFRALQGLGMVTAVAMADAVPLRLAFMPTASTVPRGTIQFEDVHRFNGAIAPAGEPNLFRNALGMSDFGITSLSSTYGLLTGSQGGIFWESRRQTAGVELRQVLLGFGDPAPVSLSATVNALTRFAPKDGEKQSVGGSAALQRTGKAWTILATFAGQTGTFADTGALTENLALAWGAGFLHRGEHMNFFGEAVFPLRGQRTYGGREPGGIPLLALGIGFRLWRGTLDVMAINATSIPAGNVLSGPDSPSRGRTMDARVGTTYRYAFDLTRKSAPQGK